MSDMCISAFIYLIKHVYGSSAVCVYLCRQCMSGQGEFYEENSSRITDKFSRQRLRSCKGRANSKADEKCWTARDELEPMVRECFDNHWRGQWHTAFAGAWKLLILGMSLSCRIYWRSSDNWIQKSVTICRVSGLRSLWFPEAVITEQLVGGARVSMWER
jgi:hypothetical protein